MIKPGTIRFQSAKSLAEFLYRFFETGSTAVFHVSEESDRTFLLEFTGGM